MRLNRILFDILLIFFSCSPALATGNLSSSYEVKPNLALQPYIAKYRLYWKYIPLGNSIHSLEKLSKDKYQAKVIVGAAVKFVPFSVVEESIFKLNHGHIYPLSYKYQDHKKGKAVIGELIFDWKKMLISGTKEYVKNTKPLSLNSQDPVTQLIQLQTDLLSGNFNLHYPIAKSDKHTFYSYKVLNKEKINTKLGIIDALVLSQSSSTSNHRITKLWLAPELGYFPLAVKKYKNNKLHSQALLLDFKPLK